MQTPRRRALRVAPKGRGESPREVFPALSQQSDPGSHSCTTAGLGHRQLNPRGVHWGLASSWMGAEVTLLCCSRNPSLEMVEWTQGTHSVSQAASAMLCLPSVCPLGSRLYNGTRHSGLSKPLASCTGILSWCSICPPRLWKISLTRMPHPYGSLRSCSCVAVQPKYRDAKNRLCDLLPFGSSLPPVETNHGMHLE